MRSGRTNLEMVHALSFQPYGILNKARHRDSMVTGAARAGEGGDKWVKHRAHSGTEHFAFVKSTHCTTQGGDHIINY